MFTRGQIAQGVDVGTAVEVVRVGASDIRMAHSHTMTIPFPEP